MSVCIQIRALGRFTKILNGGGMECVVWYVKIQGRLDDIKLKKIEVTTLTFMLSFCYVCYSLSGDQQLSLSLRC